MVDLEAQKVRTIAGTGERGFLDGPALDAQFDSPQALAVDTSNGSLTVYVADTDNYRIRKVHLGEVSTIAGSGNGGSCDNSNPILARFKSPRGVCLDGRGNILVVDSGSHAIRLIKDKGGVSTLAGSPGHPSSQLHLVGMTSDGIGDHGRFYWPREVLVHPGDPSHAYVADTFNENVRRVGSVAAAMQM